MGDVALVAACDQDRSKAEAMAREYGAGAVFTDAAEMLATIQPDLLDIATPPATHAALVRLGVENARVVVCQKPFCNALEEARATARHAAETGKLVVVHENFRFEPWYRVIKGMLVSGRLGDVYQVTFRMRPGDGQGRDAYLARQPYFQSMPRFLMRETGIHFIDTFRYLFGEISGVYADLRRLNPVIAGEDAGVVLFDFASGMRGVFDANRLVDHAATDTRKTMGEMWIEGSSAVLQLDGSGRICVRDKGQLGAEDVPFAWDDRGYGGDCVHACLAHVIAHMRSGSTLENSALDYLRNLEIEDAVYRSSRDRRHVTIPQSS
jgi:predicted dehydrogenase